MQSPHGQAMAVVRKKQDDKYLKALRELVTTGGGNRQCFDCGQKGPTYVNMTIGSFVCTRCSGVLRGLTPPHRVKSISMATFTQEEIDFLKSHGNDLCAKTWLGLWDPKRAVHQDHRELMIDKYERKRYYLEPASPLKSLTNAASLKANTTSSSSSTSNNNHMHTNSNGNGNSHTTSLTNNYASAQNHKQNSMDNTFQKIQLTPPASQRTTANGLHKSLSSAISRPQQQQQNGYNNHHQQHQQHQQQHQDAFMVNNSVNGLNASVCSASTGALSDTSSCASNGFGPEADFVADFGSANIFDATSARSVGSPAVSSNSSVASSNGYAKIQPIKAAHQFMNGNANSNLQLNGTSSTNGNTENFADFDHAPIYNAPVFVPKANYQFVRKPILKKRQQPQQSTTEIDNSDFFANLKELTYDDDVVGNKKNGAEIVFSESTNNFNDPFDAYSDIVNESQNSSNSKNSNNNNNSKAFEFSTYGSQFDTKTQNQQLQQQQQQETLPKFSPLAMAAHATAMAVLDSNCHFNSSNSNNNDYNNNHSKTHSSRNPFKSDQCDVWQATSLENSATINNNNNNPNNIWPASDISNNQYASIAMNNNSCNDGITCTPNYTPSPHAVASILTPAAVTVDVTAPSTLHSLTNGITKTTRANAFNNNKTPAEDRYAALKDLDEQLRESKAVAAAAASIVASSVVDSFGNNHNINNNNNPSNIGSVNPFKSQQQSAASVMNPFQAAHNSQQNLFGQMTVIPNGIATNGFAHQTSNPQQQQQQQQQFYNYSNGFTGTTANMFPAAPAAGGPNGCGFGFGAMQQQIAATGGGMGINGGAFNNPFAATGALNSNNPFL